MDTPKNTVLTSSNPSAKIDPAAVSDNEEYPKALYDKKKSKPGALVSKLVQSAEEEKAAGDEWVPFADLTLKDEDEDEDTPKARAR